MKEKTIEQQRLELIEKQKKSQEASKKLQELREAIVICNSSNVALKTTAKEEAKKLIKELDKFIDTL